MGRPRLPLACSKCKRTPEEVKIYSNRVCVDCMRLYNKQQRAIRIEEGREFTALEKQAHRTFEIVPDTGEYGYYDQAGNWVDIPAEQN